MNLLAIDTSTEFASLALCFNGNYTHLSIEGVRQHALVLLPHIDKLLKAQAVTLSQLDGIVVGRGPGSFTGLRVACSAVKALAYAHDLPVYSVSSLAAIAYSVSHLNSGPILAAIDARMGQLYWAFYDEKHQALSPEAVNFPQDIAWPSDEKIILAGVGLGNYPQQMSQALLSSITAIHELSLSAEVMIKMVQVGLIRPESAKDIEPVYVRDQITQGGSGG